MSNEELVRMIQQQEDKAALLAELYEQNRPLIAKYAMRYRDRKESPEDFEDLMQEGFLALADAADRFDPEAGVLFMSFAGHWIRASMGKCCVYKLAGMRADRKPLPVDSLQREIPWEEDLTVEDTVRGVCDPIGEAEDHIEQEQDRSALEAALSRLPENMAAAVRGYYLEGQGYHRQAEAQGTTYSKVKTAAASGLSRMSKDRNLKAYAISRGFVYNLGLKGSGFFRTGTSPTEQAAFRLLELEEGAAIG